MEWTETRIKTSSEGVELISGFLMVNNIPNVRIIDDESMDRFLLEHSENWDYRSDEGDSAPQIEGAEIVFYIQEENESVLPKLKSYLSNLPGEIPEIDFGSLELTLCPVNDDDWLHEWRKTYKPFRIGKRIIVKPCWEEYESSPEEVVFTIDPGAVFGTGLHATTQLCIMALEDLDLHGAKVLDIGCGSGILSVVSLLLGASSALACDIDPGAERCAMENAKLNNIDASRYTARTCNIFDEDIKDKYDIILANIVADVIIELSPEVRGFLTEKGLFIASGIIDERMEEVRKALNINGLNIIEEKQLDGWHCVIARAEYA